MTSDLRRALAYILPYWRRLTLVVGISLVSTALSLALPYLSRALVDQALIGRDLAALYRIVALFAAITVAGFGLNYVSGLRYTRVSADILFDMRLAVYQHLQRLSPRFYARTRLGEIVSRLNNDIGEIQRIAAEATLAWVGNVLFLIGSIGMLAWLDLPLFAVGVSLLPASIWALARYRRRLEGHVGLMRERSADVGSFLIETLQGMKLVVTSNAQTREARRFRQKNDRFVDAVMAMQRTSYLSGGLPGLLLSGSTALVFLYGGQRVISEAITLGTFVAFMAYHMRLLAPVQALMGLYTSLATVRVSLGRVHEILDVAPDVHDDAAAPHVASARGEITFEDVSFTFDRGQSVLDGVSFTVSPGEVVAFVGPSGSGKSTIADLLLRLLDPDSGSIRLDGRDLRSIRLEDLRLHVALVDQEPFVFHATIAENLRYARPEATEDDVRAAAQAAGLDTVLARLPEGYETVVGERGMALSAGERQRLAVARAFLANPVVLVLDEPTSSLDPIAERRITDGYEAVMRGRTTIVITHRFDLARQADRVFVLDGTRIVEHGSPRELEAKAGAFAGLFAGR